jgi:hypothetical protein
MDNLRHHYRHPLGPQQRLPVDIVSAAQRQTFRGEVINLSVGGMKVWLPDQTALLGPADRLLARITLPGTATSLAVSAAVVYAAASGGQRFFGLFLVPVNPAVVEQRHLAIWRFLLTEQRRALRGRTQEGVPA